jgi:hypothetical protein
VHDPLRDAAGGGGRGKSAWELRVLPGPGDPGTAPPRVDHAAAHGGASDSSEEGTVALLDGELSFMYRYILRESCSQFDSLPLTSLMGQTLSSTSSSEPSSTCYRDRTYVLHSFVCCIYSLYSSMTPHRCSRAAIVWRCALQRESALSPAASRCRRHA